MEIRKADGNTPKPILNRGAAHAGQFVDNRVIFSPNCGVEMLNRTSESMLANFLLFLHGGTQ